MFTKNVFNFLVPYKVALTNSSEEDVEKGWDMFSEQRCFQPNLCYILFL